MHDLSRSVGQVHVFTKHVFSLYVLNVSIWTDSPEKIEVLDRVDSQSWEDWSLRSGGTER